MLRGNAIRAEGATALGKGLKENKSLEKLDLSGCSISATGAQGLAEGLSSSALKELVLSSNKIGNAGAVALGASLKGNHRLKELQLYYCGIEAAGARGLLEGLMERHSALTRLDLVMNPIQDEDKRALQSSAKQRQKPLTLLV